MAGTFKVETLVWGAGVPLVLSLLSDRFLYREAALLALWGFFRPFNQHSIINHQKTHSITYKKIFEIIGKLYYFALYPVFLQILVAFPRGRRNSIEKTWRYYYIINLNMFEREHDEDISFQNFYYRVSNYFPFKVVHNHFKIQNKIVAFR